MSVVIRKKLSDRVKKIALRHGIPYVTVETVLKDYLKGLVEDAKNGERIVIDGIVTVTVARDVQTGELIPRSRISSSLKGVLDQVNSEILAKQEADN